MVSRFVCVLGLSFFCVQESISMLFVERAKERAEREKASLRLAARLLLCGGTGTDTAHSCGAGFCVSSFDCHFTRDATHNTIMIHCCSSGCGARAGSLIRDLRVQHRAHDSFPSQLRRRFTTVDRPKRVGIELELVSRNLTLPKPAEMYVRAKAPSARSLSPPWLAGCRPPT